MKHGAGSGKPLCSLADLLPILVVEFLAGGDELVQPAFGLQFNFKLGDVEVLGVAQFPQHDRVHQLGDPLRDLAGIPFLGDLEEDDLRGEAGVDQVQELGHPLVFDLLLEQRGEWLAADRSVLQGIAQVLGKRTLATTEEAQKSRRRSLREAQRALRPRP